jgi:hypothetical protein
MPSATVLIGAVLAMFVLWVIINGKANAYLSVVGL